MMYLFMLLVGSVLVSADVSDNATDPSCDTISPGIVFLQQEDPRCLDVPVRSASGRTGTEFAQKFYAENQEVREEAVITEVLSGNIPDFLRYLVEIKVSISIDSEEYTLTYYVTPDYLSVGSDRDYFLIPLRPSAAQRIADSLDAMLPTRVMVDQMWNAAELTLEPMPISPSDSMTTISVMRMHDRMVYEQRSSYMDEFVPGTLVVGHKKDVILSNRIYDHPRAPRVVIYGWHRKEGSPIQPVYNGHAMWYADYSHGIRLVLRNARLNGSPVDLMDVLCDVQFSQLISDEGPICRGY